TPRKFQFLVDVNGTTPKDIREEEISLKAGELVGKLYDALKIRYKNPDDKNSLRSLNILCVRIVFLLYSEDSGLFAKSQFHDFLKKQNNPRRALIDLFEILSQKIEERDPYLDSDLAAFPYVNGGLFEEKNIEIPQLDGEPLEIILRDMSESFDWSGISPTIFGALFESTLNPETRRSGGMHYTSIENIHKVIDPLFLENLTTELNKILKSKSQSRTKNLISFQKKLGSLKFLDPACGSGNFLTETYLSLRQLENQILSELTKQQINFASGDLSPIQVKISQFFGIEINDFAVAVAKTALWIAEAQMWSKTKDIIKNLDEFFPLGKFENIIEANALTFDWRTLIKPDELDFIMGNPPFVGYSNQTREQKSDLLSVYVDEAGKPYKTAGKIDYVAGWYFKAADFIKDSNIRAAFVSTNSITQGEQVAGVFKPLKDRFGIHIDFAWKTFKWSSEAKDKAQVHVVIIGFSATDSKTPRRLYSSDGLVECANINFYLVPGDDVFIEARKTPICPDAPMMTAGNRPADGGHLIIDSQEEYEDFIKREPKAKKFIKRFMSAYDFINNSRRYCLWLVDATPEELHKMPAVMERIKLCKQDRLNGAPDRQKLAETPWLFREQMNPENYIAIPKTSSENRNYIPIDWLDASIIPGDALRIIPDATLYHFGVLTSRVHMAWMRATAGRLKSDYRYSNTVVYNNFVWPAGAPQASVNDKQRAKIEQTAQKILDARAKYPESSFASLYNDDLMPPELKRAHKENDAAVCEAYGFKKDISEEEIVSELMRLYRAIAGRRPTAG
ncbi:MAG: class I SAM-dependent DNA methyltransferase, partial [Synergistaceae bacterium]|nr:class I SAM-dependent DNA methyltransferase [Synergistaceae bacterium]